MERERFDRIFDVSFTGVVECTRQFLPVIVEQRVRETQTDTDGHRRTQMDTDGHRETDINQTPRQIL